MRTDFVVLLGILAFAIGSMPIFALTARGKHDPLDVDDRGGFVLGDFIRTWFYWFIRPILAVSLALRLSPTAFNLLGVAFGILGGFCFATGL